ncbi:C2 domain-containing protein [Haematococcus lacustris]
MTLEAGVLKVTLLYAKDLRDKDLFGKQDPYCKLRVGNQLLRSKTHQRGGKSPVWNETFHFNLVNDNTLNIEVMDEDMLSDDFIGKVSVSLSDVRVRRNMNLQAPVLSHSGKPHGFLSLELHFEPNVAAGSCKPDAAPTYAGAPSYHGQASFAAPPAPPAPADYPPAAYPPAPAGYPQAQCDAGAGQSGKPGTQAYGTPAPGESPSRRLPHAWLPASRLPASRLPSTRLPTLRLPSTGLPSPRLPPSRLPPSGLPPARLPPTFRPPPSRPPPLSPRDAAAAPPRQGHGHRGSCGHGLAGRSGRRHADRGHRGRWSV